MKVLFIGGTGVISTANSELCIEKGIDLYLFNRGTSLRTPPDGAHIINCDIRNIQSTEESLANHQFDVVVDWIAYNKKHVEADYNLFKNKTKQYVFISSCATYQKPPEKYPIDENTPLYNPGWDYATDKILAEKFLMEVYHKDNFPVTIVRPSHTYDKTKTPIRGDYNLLYRLKQGKKIILHEDGKSLWTLTHAKDFAKGFIGLLGNSKAIGEAFNITSDEILTWDKIAAIIAEKAGCELKVIYLPADFISRYDSDWGPNLKWDKRFPGIFDNSKIKNIVPEFKPSITFSTGAEEIVEWYSNKKNQIVNNAFDLLQDKMISDYESGK
jgi:nucleoside-diphosphate-sugar epimerase